MLKQILGFISRGAKTDIILKAVNEYLMEFDKEQIIIAFEQSEKEISDLHQRAKEGIETATRLASDKEPKSLQKRV